MTAQTGNPPHRPNYFELLELDGAETDSARVDEALRTRQRKWTKDRSKPGNRGNEAKRNLEYIPDIKRVMLDDSLRQQEAEAWRDERMERQKQAAQTLDAKIEILAADGSFSQQEVEALVREFSAQGFTRESILARIQVDILPEEPETAEPAAPTLDAVTWKRMLDLLHQAGKRDLYDLLGMRRDAAAGDLLQAAQQLDGRLRHKPPEARTDAQRKLVGDCLNIFKRDELRQQYDNSLNEVAFAALDDRLAALQTKGYIPPQAMDILSRTATSQGLDAQAARGYVRRFAAKHGLRILGTSQPAKLEACGYCGVRNPAGQDRCGYCASPLQVSCPQCAAATIASASTCTKCGFAIGGVVKARRMLQEAEANAGEGDLPTAILLLLEAEQLVPGMAGLDRCRKVLRLKLRPRLQHVEARSDGVTLRWSPPVENSGLRYEVYRQNHSRPFDAGGRQPVVQCTEQVWIDRDVRSGEKYWYHVLAVLEGIRSDPLEFGPVTVLGTVADPQAIAVPQGVGLSWTAPAGCSSVRVHRSLTAKKGAQAAWLQIGRPAKQKLEDASAECGQPYTYRFTAEFPNGQSSEPVTLDYVLYDPQPVTGLRANSQPGGVELRWELPRRHCSRVLLVRNVRGVPEAPTDGDVLARGMIDHYCDKRAVPGVRQHYAVFSLLDERASRDGASCTGYGLPIGVGQLATHFEPPAVVLSFAPPVPFRHAVVFRADSSGGEFRREKGELKPPPGCRRLGATTDGSFRDATVELGRTYHYYVIVESAQDGMFSAAASAQAVVPARPPAAHFTDVACRLGCIQLSWESPPGGRRIQYQLTRRERSPDGRVTQEKRIYEGGDTCCSDSDVQLQRVYEYELVAIADGLACDSPCTTSVEPRVEATSLSADELPNAVRVRWRLPDHVDAVRVERLPNPDLPGALWQLGPSCEVFLDRELPAKQTVEYRIQIRFRGRWSHGAKLAAVPAAAVPVLPRVWLKAAAGSVSARLDSESVKRGDVQIRIGETTPGLAKQDVARLQKPWCHVAFPGTPWQPVAVSRLDAAQRFAVTERTIPFEEVQEVAAQAEDGNLIVTWKAAAGCKYVTVALAGTPRIVAVPAATGKFQFTAVQPGVYRAVVRAMPDYGVYSEGTESNKVVFS